MAKVEFIHFFLFLFDYSENMLNFAAEIKYHTLMTKEEFLAKIERAEKQPGKSFANVDELDKYIRSL